MRYHHEKPYIYLTRYGQTYRCDHPVYNECTLFKIGEYGLAVIQQRFYKNKKLTYWSKIDPWLIDDIYLNEKFEEYFKNRAGKCVNGLYPTVTIRQLMWAMKMKPIKRERWETCFDRKDI